MWIPKWVRDKKKGVDSAVPTQVVSNEEFIPRPQTTKQRQIEDLIMRMSEEKAKKLGMERRDFMATSMGIATCFLASNMVWGKKAWAVEEEDTMDIGAYEDKYPKGQYFIMDVQAHFTNGIPIGFRNMEFVKNMDFKLDNSPESYSYPNFVKEMFFDSETSMLVISGMPFDRWSCWMCAVSKMFSGRSRCGTRLSKTLSFTLIHVLSLCTVFRSNGRAPTSPPVSSHHIRIMPLVSWVG